LTALFLCDKVTFTEGDYLKNYYVINCFDGVPILEFILNQNYKALEDVKTINWGEIKYIILDFKTERLKNNKTIEKGSVTYQNKILTKRIIYIRINIYNAHMQEKRVKKRSYQKLIEFSEILFQKEPRDFFEYIKSHKLMNMHDLKNLKKALENMENEQKILDSWKNVCSKKK